MYWRFTASGVFVEDFSSQDSLQPVILMSAANSLKPKWNTSLTPFLVPHSWVKQFTHTITKQQKDTKKQCDEALSINMLPQQKCLTNDNDYEIPKENDDTKMTNKDTNLKSLNGNMLRILSPTSLSVVPTMTSGVDVCAASRVGKTYRHIQSATSSMSKCCGKKWTNVIPSGKLTWNLKMMISNRNLLFQGFIFRFHVIFRGCKPGKSPSGKLTWLAGKQTQIEDVWRCIPYLKIDFFFQLAVLVETGV